MNQCRHCAEWTMAKIEIIISTHYGPFTQEHADVATLYFTYMRACGAYQ